MKCNQCGSNEFYKREFIDSNRSFRDTKEYDKFGITEEKYKGGNIDETASAIAYKAQFDGYFSITNNCDCYICKNCGHIELFAKQDFLDKLSNQEKIDQEIEEKIKEKEVLYKKKYDELFEFAEKLRKEVNKLNEIISNENSTMKAYNEAKAKLPVRNEYLKTCDYFLKDWNVFIKYHFSRVDRLFKEYNEKINK